LIHFYKSLLNIIKMAENHISAAVVFEAPAGTDPKPMFGEMYSAVKAGTDGCIFYGFATNGNMVLVREAYTTAAALAEHGKDVKEKFESVVAQIGKDKVRVSVMGPESQLKAIRPKMEERGARIVHTDAGVIAPTPMPKGCADTHVSMAVEFVVPDGKMGEVDAALPKLYASTKNGAGANGCYYYGFGKEGGNIVCREGYKDAETALKHLADVKDILEAPAKAVGPGGMKINVVGPKAELDKLRPKLEPRGAIFWELDSGAFFK